ncbi:MAG: hypothetical protein LC642_01100 [Verrucomicrobiaceae bacterium]|nr:hypothetical protein [Verrucomicrobiaceae bacterium]
MFVATVCAQVPQLINYQGRVVVGSTNFNGTGQFKFALINGSNGSTLWRNHGTGAGEPANAVALTVSNGLYSVLLGDATLTNMAVIPNTVFNNADVRLRVWFSDGSGFQQLNPDQRIAAVGYAMMASSVVDGAITNAKLDSGLAAELPRKSAGQTFTGANTFNNLGNQFTGNGSGLTQLNASALSSGTVLDARLSSNIPRLNAANDFVGEQSITGGNLGVGTTTPGERLEVSGADATMRIRNSNDAIGGWIGDSFGALQLGIYNPSAAPVGLVPANTKRSFFGIDGVTGKVGSLTNNFLSPAFRVLLDDGAGNISLGGRIVFNGGFAQKIELGGSYAFGTQNNNLYQRSASGFSWFKNGTHSSNDADPGAGGTRLMRLDGGGNLEFNNMPGLHFAQGWGEAPSDQIVVQEGQEITADEISIRCPTAGYIHITAMMHSEGNSEYDFSLYDVTSGSNRLVRVKPRVQQENAFLSWVVPVNSAMYVNLKTTCFVADDGLSGTVAQARIAVHNLTAVFVPVRYQ